MFFFFADSFVDWPGFSTASTPEHVRKTMSCDIKMQEIAISLAAKHAINSPVRSNGPSIDVTTDLGRSGRPESRCPLQSERVLYRHQRDATSVNPTVRPLGRRNGAHDFSFIDESHLLQATRETLLLRPVRREKTKPSRSRIPRHTSPAGKLELRAGSKNDRRN